MRQERADFHIRNRFASSQSDLCSHNFLETVVIDRKAELLGDSLHGIIIGQNLRKNKFYSFLPADLQEQFQEMRAKPLTLAFVAHDDCKFGFINPMDLN
jgi:hypothetical protein